ncbi:MAG: acyl-CoA dehydrogenase [Burkholderiaceae bacterium]
MDDAVPADWLGRREFARDMITESACVRMAATLDRDPPELGAGLPAPWHWMAFLPQARQSAISADGHPPRAGFLAQGELPRRMWASGSMRLLAPVPIGVPIERESEIVGLDDKRGRSGRLLFLTLRHRIRSVQGGLLIDERQHIVYREPSAGAQAMPAGEPAPTDPHWRRRIDPDPTLLFRFSALTFNAHRIHYDRRYAMDVEGYPGLVVHGPLLATMLLDALRHEGGLAQTPDWFEFRAQRPVIDVAPFWVCGRHDADDRHSLWIEDNEGFVCVKAYAGRVPDQNAP